LLHLVGYLYYWQMGFNSVFKGLMQMHLKCSDCVHLNRLVSSVYFFWKSLGWFYRKIRWRYPLY